MEKKLEWVTIHLECIPNFLSHNPITSVYLLDIFCHITSYAHSTGSLLTSRWNITPRFKWALECSGSSCTAILKLCLEKGSLYYTSFQEKITLTWCTSDVREKKTKKRVRKVRCSHRRWMGIKTKMESPRTLFSVRTLNWNSLWSLY